MKKRGEIQKEFYEKNRVIGDNQKITKDGNRSGLFNESAGK